jgi:hypothetical protein
MDKTAYDDTFLAVVTPLLAVVGFEIMDRASYDDSISAEVTTERGSNCAAGGGEGLRPWLLVSR